MSLPSLPTLISARNIANVETLEEHELEDLLLSAMKRDLPLACEFLHKLSHGDGTPSPQDPNSELGKQLIRICAGDALRRVAQTYLCHGKPISFSNCCAPAVGPVRPPKEQYLLQIKTQAGPIAYADC